MEDNKCIKRLDQPNLNQVAELMKGIGKGVKNFKDGVKGIEDDINIDDNSEKK